jgi:hypothetical protein
MGAATVNLPVDGGMDFRTPGGIFRLDNMRPSNYTHGLETTPRFYAASTLTIDPLWNLATAAEVTPSSMTIRAVVRTAYSTFDNTYVITSCNVIRSIGSDIVPFSGSTLQGYQQTAYPASESTHTGCRLVINSLTGLALNRGQTVDVQIDGAATFQWRKAGGAWTSLVPITTAGVSIDGGNATVYFLESTGFTIGDTWTWTRTDTMLTDVTSTAQTQSLVDFVSFNERTLFTAADRLFVIQYAGTTPYYITYGYRPVSGSFVNVFEGLVFTLTQNGGLYNSDQTDPDNFISSSQNEADYQALPLESARTDSALFGVGLWKLNNQLYILTSIGVYTTQYYGLPLVTSVKFLTAFDAYRPVTTVDHAIGCDAGDVYYIVQDGHIVAFDGSTFTEVGHGVSGIGRFGRSPARTRPVYDFNRQELIFGVWISNIEWLVVYDTRRKLFYFRTVNFGNILFDSISCVSIINVRRADTGQTPRIVVGRTTRKLYVEDDSFLAPLTSSLSRDKDTTNFEPCRAIFGPIGVDSLSVVKDLTSVYIGLNTSTTTVGGYATGSDVRATAVYNVVDGGSAAGPAQPGLITYTGGASYITSDLVDGTASTRIPFRAILVGITLSKTGEAVGPVFVNHISLGINNWPQQRETR